MAETKKQIPELPDADPLADTDLFVARQVGDVKVLLGTIKDYILATISKLTLSDGTASDPSLGSETGAIRGLNMTTSGGTSKVAIVSGGDEIIEVVNNTGNMTVEINAVIKAEVDQIDAGGGPAYAFKGISEGFGYDTSDNQFFVGSFTGTRRMICEVEDNLNSTSINTPLSANMGRLLDLSLDSTNLVVDLKLDKTSVTDNTLSTSPTDALSANQGKLLNDAVTVNNLAIGNHTGRIVTLENTSLTSNDIINNLTSTSVVDALSANQGKVLDEKTATLGYTLLADVDDLLGQTSGWFKFDVSTLNHPTSGGAGGGDIYWSSNGTGGTAVSYPHASPSVNGLMRRRNYLAGVGWASWVNV